MEYIQTEIHQFLVRKHLPFSFTVAQNPDNVKPPLCRPPRPRSQQRGDKAHVAEVEYKGGS